MTHFVARTIASGDAMHDCTVFVINDSGTWMLKRPQDYQRAEIPGLIQAARQLRLIEPLPKGAGENRRSSPGRSAPGALRRAIQQMDDQCSGHDLLPSGC